MGEPVDFTGTNRQLLSPPGRDDVGALKAFSNGACCVTCWRLSAAEIAEVQRTGRIWLSLLSGSTMPPALVGSEDLVRSICLDHGGTFPRQGEIARG